MNNDIYIQTGLASTTLIPVNTDLTICDWLESYEPEKARGLSLTEKGKRPCKNKKKFPKLKYVYFGKVKDPNKREDSNVVYSTAITLDIEPKIIDRGSDEHEPLAFEDIQQVINDKLASYRRVYYETLNSTPGYSRVRLVLLPSRPMNKTEKKLTTEAVIKLLEPLPIDSSSGDYSRVQGLPVLTGLIDNYQVYGHEGNSFPVVEEISNESKESDDLLDIIDRYEDDEAMQLIDRYVEFDRENLLQENFYYIARNTLIKAVQTGEISKKVGLYGVKQISLGNSEWERKNIKEFHRGLKSGNYPEKYSFKDRFVDVMDHLAVKNIYSLFRTNAKGNPTKSIYNIRVVIENTPSIYENLYFNLFNEKIEKFKDTIWGTSAGWWGDDDTSMLRVYLDDSYSLQATAKDIEDAVLYAAKQNPIHPIKNYIESITWDGKERTETFFIDLLGAEDNPYTREVTRVWFTGLITRIYKPGCKFDIVPILTGEQGIGKSSAVYRLLPDYFTDQLRSFGENEDDKRLLQDVVIVELGELKGLKKSDINQVKNFITARDDRFRQVYGRHHTIVPRHSVFIGTSNFTDILSDNTGNRRFWPIECGVNRIKVHPMDIEDEYFSQVLAEAYTWLGNPLKISDEVDQMANEIRENFNIEDPILDDIKEFLNTKVPSNWYYLTKEERKHFISDPDNTFTRVEEPLQELTITSITEIAELVFDETTSNRSRHHIIRSKMDNMPGWSRSKVKKRISKHSSTTTVYVKDLST